MAKKRMLNLQMRKRNKKKRLSHCVWNFNSKNSILIRLNDADLKGEYLPRKQTN